MLRGLPLNVIYWAKTGPDSYEILDGQQRTVSLCEYVHGGFSIKEASGESKYFGNLPKDIQEKILDYKLFVYVCDGTGSEKLEWFKIINIAGEKLTDQELLNAVYAGPWVTSAKKYFSKTGSTAYNTAGDYLTGSSIRQEYLETALRWISDRDDRQAKEKIARGENINHENGIAGYMSRHQYDPTAQGLWTYFYSVIEWVKSLFPTYRSPMKGVEWGILYNQYSEKVELDPAKLESEVQKLMGDEDATNKKGIYEYVFTGNERALNIRVFSQRDKRTAYEKQHGKCAKCGKSFAFEEMQGDHIKPWSKGGATTPENCQMLCRDCNLAKSNL